MSAAAAEPPKRQRWYLHADSKVYGPYDQATIASMIARTQILRDDKVQVEGGSVWIDAGVEPTLGPIFRELCPPLGEPPVRRDRSRAGWIRFLPTTILVLIFGWLAWPYYAAYSLIKAVRESDIATLERRVDWTSLRQGLRGDLNARLLQGLSGKKGDASDAMASGFAAMLGPAVVNNLIDGYVTPQAIAALARNKSSDAPPKADEAAPSEVKSAVAQVRHFNWEQVKYAFFSGSPLSFEVDILPPAETPQSEPVNFVFHWNGDWRLVRVNLPLDAATRPSTASSREASKVKAGSNQTSLKSSEPPPIGIRLQSKWFKPANYKDNDYQAEIEIALSVTNDTTQGIRAFDGILAFTDLLDNEIFSTKLAINDPIGPGHSINWKGAVKFNQFMDSHQGLKNAETANLKTRFAARKILYSDGSTKEFD